VFAKRVMYACQLVSKPILMEPMYVCDITVPTSAVSAVYETLNVCWGQVEDPVGGDRIAQHQEFQVFRRNAWIVYLFFYGGVLGLFDFSLLYLSSSVCSGPRRRAVKGRGKGEKQKRSCEAKNAPCARNTVEKTKRGRKNERASGVRRHQRGAREEQKRRTNNRRERRSTAAAGKGREVERRR